MSEYHRLVEEQIPRLRRYARALTSNRERADDLVQDTLVRALVKEHLWQPGTDLRAWLFTIMHNQHVNIVRHGVRDAAAVDVEQVSGTLSATTDPTASCQLRELDCALSRLPLEQRQVILLVGQEGMPYEMLPQFCYVAAEILLPIVLAFVLNLVLQPAMRVLDRAHIRHGFAALLIILVLFGTLAGLGTALSGPAASWAQQLPAGIPKLQERLGFLSRPLAAVQKFADQAQGLTQGDQPKAVAVAVQGSGLSDRLFTGTRSFAGGLLETVLVLFFLLVSGDTFLRRLVEILPSFKNKRQAVDISQQIERDVSAYLFTITIMNLAVGVATGALMALCGLGDPLLWGALAFLLNYIPILGPIMGVVVFLLVGLLSINTLWVALLPAALYLAIHIIEGETVTPMLLARRFTINPVLVVLALVFWYWMWGIPGAILATPMLAITKIVCDRIHPLKAFGHFIEG